MTDQTLVSTITMLTMNLLYYQANDTTQSMVSPFELFNYRNNDYDEVVKECWSVVRHELNWRPTMSDRSKTGTNRRGTASISIHFLLVSCFQDCSIATNMMSNLAKSGRQA